MSSASESSSERFSSNSEDVSSQSDVSRSNNTFLEEDRDSQNDLDVNNQVLNIDRMEQYLLSGTCGPVEENRNESFSYTASDAIKKTHSDDDILSSYAFYFSL